MLLNANARSGLFSFVRFGALLGYDTLATLCGLYAAGLLTVSDDVPPALAARVAAAAPLLVSIRLAAVVGAGLHRWWFRTAGLVDLARLVFAMAGGSMVFALTCRFLPRPIYVLELFLTTILMAAFRFAPRAIECPRRALNVGVALVALVVTLPLWLVIALAIKLSSRGPVFYLQERVGLDLRSTRPLPNDPRRRVDLGGRPFTMYKFRTMAADAERATGAVWSAPSDPRVTLVGRVLRQCRLDELPQLLNVLKGDMNVVGPRPERPTIFAELRKKIPDYPLRQRARPGITGYAQVNLEYDASIEDVSHKLEYDLAYLTEQSVATDLHIMARTLPVMLFRNRMLTGRPTPPLGSLRRVDRHRPEGGARA